MNRKLYIIIYYNCDDVDYFHCWDKIESGAIKQFKEMKESNCAEYEIISTHEVKEAVHKEDLKERYNRYLIKPLSK